MAITFPDMYDYNDATGMTVPITSDIKEYVQNSFKDIFGDDMDLSDETPAGRLVEALTLMFKNAVGVNAQNLNQINIQYATGQYLDSLARFFGLERLAATRTEISIVVCSEEPNQLLPTGTVLTDKDGHTYTVLEQETGGIITGDIRTKILIPGVGDVYRYRRTGKAISNDYGPIRPYTVLYSTFPHVNDTLLSFSSVPGITEVFCAQDSNGSTGRLEETDAELRERITSARNFNSGCTQAIANAIWKAAPELRTVRVIENPYDTQQTINGVKLYPHSILVCVKGLFVSDPEDTVLQTNLDNIAKAIYMTKPAGINYTDSEHYPSGDMYYKDTMITTDINTPSFDLDRSYILYNPTVTSFQLAQGYLFFSKFCIPVTDESSGIQYPVFFYSAEVIRIRIVCKLHINGYSGTNVVDDVKRVITQYVTGKITKLTDTELMMIISQSITGVFITSFDMYEYPENYFVEGATVWGKKITEVTPTALQVISPMSIDVTVQNM